MSAVTLAKESEGHDAYMIFRIILPSLLLVAFAQADPQITSWLTQWSGNYARVYLADADVSSNTTYTTWSRGTMTQALPTYAGVSRMVA